MKERFLKFYNSQDQISFYSYTLALLIAIFITVFFLLTSSHLPKLLPLFYSKTWGELQLSSKLQFIILPLVIVLTTLINMTLSWHLHSSQVLLKRSLSIVTSLVALIIFVTALKIIYIYI